MAVFDDVRGALGRTLAAVMAGGAGERFWPMSRRDRPKPFIHLVGDRPLLAQTFQRLVPPLRRSQVHVVVGQPLVPLVGEIL
ncbi:MAG: hypothetical protein FJ098_06395, partial [Deltaproteobacteria bacterium]|nr:hypothetical protein [Deltaproteobacteria bacterium]